MRCLDHREVGQACGTPSLGGRPPKHDDHTKVRQQREELVQRGAGLLTIRLGDGAYPGPVAHVPRDDVPGDDLSGAVDASLSQDAPHVLRGLVIIVGTDEARAGPLGPPVAPNRTPSGRLEQEQDRGPHTGLSGIDPRHGLAASAIRAQPTDEVGQRSDMGLAKGGMLAGQFGRVPIGAGSVSAHTTMVPPSEDGTDAFGGERPRSHGGRTGPSATAGRGRSSTEA